MAGADAPKHLLTGDEFNETGYWESDRLWQLHDELLQDMGTAWSSILTYPVSVFHSPKSNRYKARIIEALRDEFANSALFCLKDPRICRLLPLWMPVLKDEGVEARYVIISRSPLEVAESLKGRFGVHSSESLMLWLRHTLEAEYFTRGRRRVFVTYDQVMSDWRSVLRRITQRLGIVWPRRSSEIAVEFERIISDRLRHYRVGDDKIYDRDDLPEWIASTYRACVASSEGQEEAQLEVFDRIRHEIDTADKAFEPLLVIQKIQRDASLAETTSAEARSAVLQAQVSELVARAEEREGELTRAQARLQELEPAAADAVARAEQYAAQLNERDEQIAAVKAERDAARAETATAELQLAASRAEAKDLVARVEEAAEHGVSGAELDRLQRALDFREAEVLEIRSALTLQEKAHKGESEAAQTERAIHANELRESRANARAFEARVEALSTRVAQLAAELALSAEERAELSGRRKAADLELAQLRQMLERHTSRIHSLEDDLAVARRTAVAKTEGSV